MTSVTEQAQLAGRKYLDQVKAQWDCLVFMGGSSDKFWRVRSSGIYLETWWGRNGTSGQTLVKVLSSPPAASAEREKLTQSKLVKGYAWEINAKSSPPGTWSQMTAAERKLQILAQQAKAAGDSMAVLSSKLAAAQKAVTTSGSATWYGGWGMPGAGLGVNGDFYLRESDWSIATKTNGVWTPTGTFLDWFTMTEQQRTDFVKVHGVEVSKRLISASNLRDRSQAAAPSQKLPHIFLPPGSAQSVPFGGPPPAPTTVKKKEPKPQVQRKPTVMSPGASIALGRFSALVGEEEEDGEERVALGRFIALSGADDEEGD